MQLRLFILALTALTLSALPARAQEDLNELQEKALKAAVAKIAPCIVQIETTGGADVISTGPRGAQMRKGVGPTTGLIVAADGYILSSSFNFANKPTAIFVSVPGLKERFVAKVVANDRTRMVTLLKIETNGLPVPTAAPKKDIKIGQWALALGRTLDRDLSVSPSVSIGVISALNRIWGKALQTDAKVSPVNYGGPLVNIHGQVLGILVPAAPRGDDEAAGVEWYDSGIGFAMPLEDILAVLPRLRQGTDLRKGLLGIRLESGGDQAEPKLVDVAPESAAQKAGLQKDDLILEIDGVPVNSQAQLQHKLGSKYEGDTIALKIKRGDQTLDLKDIKLAGNLTSLPNPFLGIVPLRDDPDPGEEIRYVYPQSPADQAGLKPGDRILKIGVAPGKPSVFTGRDQLTARLNTLQPGTEVQLEVQRKADKKTENVKVKLGALPDTVPDKLPDVATLKRALEKTKGKAAPKDKDDKKPETGLLKRKNASMDHEYFVYVPTNYDANASYAVLLWLHPVGKGKDKDLEDFQKAWQTFCEENHIILILPKAENENGWLSSESDALIQIVQEVTSQYTVDRQRVVAHGMGIGGQMAFYLGFTARDLIRGVATTGAVMTSTVRDNIASQRLQFFVTAGGKDPLVKEIQESKDKLTAGKFSAIYREVPDLGHQYLDARTLAELVRWLDALDRQ